MASGIRFTPEHDRIILATEMHTDYVAACVRLGLKPRDAAAVSRRRYKLKRDAAGQEPRRFAEEDEEEIDDLESFFDHLEQADALRSVLADGTKAVAWTAPVDGPIGIAFMSDIHAGASGVDYKRFREDLETVAATEALYLIVNGDLLENAKTMSKAGVALYSGLFNKPKDQMQYVRLRFGPVSEKIVLILSGNHDGRDYNAAGIDRLPDLCRELGVPYATEAGATVTVTVGSQTYTAIVKHDGPGKSRLNKSNAMRRLWDEWPWSWQNADIVALAHLHEMDIHETTRKGEHVVYLRSGSYKTGGDEYAEKGGFKPSYGVPVVILYPDERRMLPVRDFEQGVRILKSERSSR